MQVLFGLEYAHAMQDIKEVLVIQLSRLHRSTSSLEVRFADVMCSVTNSSENFRTSNGLLGLDSSLTDNQDCDNATST